MKTKEMEQKIRNCDVHVLTEVTCLRHNIPNLAFALDEWSHVLSQQIAGSALYEGTRTVCLHS